MESKHLFSAEIERLNHLASFLFTFDYINDQKTRYRLEHLLDDFNSIDFSLKICNEELSGKIIGHLCYVVPQSDIGLLVKFCRLIFTLLSRQQIILQTELETVTDYLIHCLYNNDTGPATNDVLRALGAVIYGNSGLLSKFYNDLLGPDNILVKIAFSNDELLRSAIQCIENMCIRTPSYPYIPTEYQVECFSVFLKVLQLSKPNKMDDIGFCKTLVSGLRGLQHILVSAKNPQADFLGPLLAALKVYMLYGLSDCPDDIPTCLYPMPVSNYDSNPTATPPKTEASKPKPEKTDNPNPRGGGNRQGDDKGGGKKGKKKRGGAKGKNQNKGQDQHQDDYIDTLDKAMDSMSQMNVQQQPSPSIPRNKGLLYATEDPLANYPAWSKASSSESEFSDAEGGTGSNYLRSKSTYTKVRQSALGCFYALVKATEKKVMFGYWSSFIPDSPGIGSPSQQHTIFTAIMKDPSARARTGALAVLTALVDGNKQYLMAAEDSDQYRTAPFTPFSVKLGYMIKEIHRCLLLCLASEQSNLAITQIIKCLAALIPNVPYQRLKPGLLSRTIKQIKPFISHRDPNIRVVCLSCLGSMLAVQGPLLEVTYLLNPPKSSTSHQHQLTEQSTVLSQETQDQSESTKPNPSISETETSIMNNNNIESGYHSSLSGSVGSNDGNVQMSTGVEGLLQAGSSPLGILTPNLPSGLQTPTLGEQFLFGNTGEISWVIKLCVKNIAAHLLDKHQRDGDKLPSKIVAESAPARVQARTEQKYVQPLPVRLESLQVLASMCKGYFNFLRTHLFLIRDVLQYCLEDSDKSVQLHSAKLLDELGSVLSSKLQDQTLPPSNLDADEVLQFWVPLLNGPIPNALQNVQNTGVRSTLCDCLSNIAAPVFGKLPMDKHILCITLILGLSSDEDRNVRASCVRALGVLVLYPCLREDVSFVADAANAIISSMEQTSINVKVKATWSLGNLTDALVMNRESNQGEGFTDEFSDMLLLKLFAVSVKGAGDNDKLRANAVRAVGNLLRYLPLRCYNSSKFIGQPVVTAVQTLIKNSMSGIMKVRWNACYAIGNLLKNSAIPFKDVPWMKDVIDALKTAVRDCKNFKVRINAALAFSIPKDRLIYGDSQKLTQIWNSLIQSLKSSEETTDFSEFKYRDSLIQQVMATLVHLANLLVAKDLSALSNVVLTETQSLYYYMDKYMSMMKNTPEKESHILSAESNLAKLICTESREKDTLEVLQAVFTTERTVSEDEEEEPRNPLTSAFVQTYD